MLRGEVFIIYIDVVLLVMELNIFLRSILIFCKENIIY